MTSNDVDTTPLTVAEAAVQLRIQPATLRQWIKTGRIEARKALNGQWRISRSEVDRASGVTNLQSDPRPAASE